MLETKITFDHEIIRISRLNTDNWLSHPVFSELAREAISKDSDADNKRFYIAIDRNAFDTIISKFLEKELLAFEKDCIERGENLRAELSETFEEALHEVPVIMHEPGFF